MKDSSFNVIDYMARRGDAWYASLSAQERENLAARLASLELGVSPGGPREVADILAGRFHDDGLERVFAL